MKAKFACLFVIFILSSCGDRNQASPAQPSDAAQQLSESITPYEREPGKLASKLPGEIVFSFPYYVRSDALVTAADGSSHRRTVIVLRNVSTDKAVTMVNRDMVSAGFLSTSPEEPISRRYKQTFEKSGFGRVTLNLRSSKENTKENVYRNAHRIGLDFPQESRK